MTAIIAGLVAKFWPLILGGCGILAGILFGKFKTRSAQAQVAQAGAQVAQAKETVADLQAAEAKIDEKASEATVTAVANRVHADQATAAIPDAQLDAEGVQLGILRKE